MGAIQVEIAKLERLGIIARCKSDWCSRLVPVPKPDSSLRLCIDYKHLNKVTKKINYPIPRIDDIHNLLGQARYFSTLDATSGYYQIALETKDKHKTAFRWKNESFCFNRMPFGLSEAPGTFQRAMDELFAGKLQEFVFPDLDDIIIFSKTPDEHMKHLEMVLYKIRSSGLKLNEEKCHFF